MKRFRIIAIACILLLLAGCSRSGSADSDPETFLRDLYGDRLVVEDGKFYYRWETGESYLHYDYEEAWQQPLLASDLNRYDLLVEDGTLGLNIESLHTFAPGELGTRSQYYTAHVLMTTVENHTSYDALPLLSYVDIKLDGEWYSIFNPPTYDLIGAYFPLPEVAEHAIWFVRFDAPSIVAPPPDGEYRAVVVLDMKQDTENSGILSYGRYAVSAEFTIRDGELAG